MTTMTMSHDDDDGGGGDDDDGGRGAAGAGASAGNATLRLSCSNDYERTLGIPIGDGLYEQYGGLLAEMHQVTRLEASVARGDGADDDGDDGGGSASYDWDVDGDAVSRGGGRAVNVTFSALGAHAVRVSRSLAGSVLGMGGAVTGEFTVYAKYVRRELRDLSDSDRERYFAAVHTLYVVGQAEGERRYGPDYRSAAWLVREHLNGAAQQDCDHWHDDAVRGKQRARARA